ncbi:MAG: flavin reductase family protein [Wujia sp.]
MGKQVWKPGNMLYPVPAVMVTVGDGKGNDNVLTIAWTGTVNSDPPMVSISVRKSRYSHELLTKNGEFVINLISKDLCFAMDYCGVRSGRDEDKFEKMHLTKEDSATVSVPSIKESPVNIECKVTQVLELGSHDMFLAEVTAVRADEAYMDETGKFDLNQANLVAYSHGQYFTLGEYVGKFGYSVQKK